MPLKVTASYASVEELDAAFQAEAKKGGLLVRGATLDQAHAGAMADCTLEVKVEGQRVELMAKVAAIIPGVGVAVMFPGGVAPLEALLVRLKAGPAAAIAPIAEGDADLIEELPPLDDEEDEAAPAEEAAPGTAGARLKLLNVSQKMALALAADRETRFALLRDTNKVLHLYVLKNPRIGLDEVQHACKMTTLSPDALRFIAEHHEWGMNPTICTGLVRNPRMPLPLAIKLLDRVPMSEIRVIAKGTGRMQLVTAARKKVNGRVE